MVGNREPDPEQIDTTGRRNYGETISTSKIARRGDRPGGKFARHGDWQVGNTGRIQNEPRYIASGDEYVEPDVEADIRPTPMVKAR